METLTAKEELRKEFENAKKGRYYTHAWYSYMDKRWIERLIVEHDAMEEELNGLRST